MRCGLVINRINQHQAEVLPTGALGTARLAIPQAAATVGARTVGIDDGATGGQNGPKAQLLLKRYRWLLTESD